jgi:alpha-glucoside transport system substrate-binding protein
LLPQPGTICGYVDGLVSLEEMGFDIAELEAAHGSFFIALGQCDDGQHYAIPTNANMKSIVWYNKPLFETNGYTIPTTWDDLLALTEQAKTDGVTPWCIGIGSEAATGWPGTDWIEDIMIRTVGVEGYLDWVANDLKFSSPEVTNAFDEFGKIMFGDGYVLGGADQVAAIDFRDAPDPMFNDPPSCLLHRQANFIVNFFPEGVVLGEDTDFFFFPDIDPAYTGAVMGAGELAVVFDARPEVVQFLKDFSGPTWQCVHASPVGDPTLGGNDTESIERISANANTPNECYSTDTIKRLAGAVATALTNDAFAFDGSDIMPAAVGTGSFWTGMIDWTRGGDYADIAATIDASF